MAVLTNQIPETLINVQMDFSAIYGSVVNKRVYLGRTTDADDRTLMAFRPHP